MTTHVIFLLDESGSMEPVAADVRGGFNHYVDTLRGDGNDYLLTAYTFGTHLRSLCTSKILADVPRLDDKNYRPLENTALYDAIAYALKEEKKKSATEEHPYGTDPILFLIMTDGEENASRYTSKDMVTAQIARRESAKNWTFVYLGADQDAWAIAKGLGLSMGNVVSYTSTNTNLTFQNLATATSASTTSNLIQTENFFQSK